MMKKKMLKKKMMKKKTMMSKLKTKKKKKKKRKKKRKLKKSLTNLKNKIKLNLYGPEKLKTSPKKNTPLSINNSPTIGKNI